MRVLLLPNSYPPVLGGLQTVAHTLAQHLCQQGHGVRVVTNRYPRSLQEQEVRDGVSVHRWLLLTPKLGHLRRGRPELFLASFYHYPHTLARLTHLMQTFRPDVVNVHFPDAQTPYVLHLRRRFNFRLVVSLHGHDIERFTEGAERGAGRPLAYAGSGSNKLLREADAVTACSRHLLDRAIRLESSVLSKGRAISNGVDTQRFHDKRAYSHGRPYVLAYGRLSYIKGFDLLLEAFAQTGLEYQQVDLIVAGEGEERETLLAQTQRLGLRERVHFFGRATSDDVVRLLNGCLFAVVPSRTEPFGIVALEALAAGKPVLATRVGGLSELLTEMCRSTRSLNRGGTASREQPLLQREVPVMLVEPSVEGVREGMREWLSPEGVENTQSRIDAAVLEDYSWARVAQRYERVLAG